MRDAIVFSTWSWEMFNVPERIALALATRGVRVLYCEMPASRFKKRGGSIGEVANGIHGFRPEFLGAKLNAFSPTRTAQWRMVARQVLRESDALGLKDPIFIYSHVKSIEPLCEAMRSRGLPLVHICMDCPEPYQYAQIALADLTLVIPKTVASKLAAQFGDGKITVIPQIYHPPTDGCHHAVDASAVPADLAELKAQGRPILGYLGPLYGRLSVSLLKELLRSRPDWEFVCFGGAATLGLENSRDLPWVSATQLPSYLRALDVGFMPYDCTEEKNLHCSPLKIFDYFSLGIPVAATPVLSLRDFGDLVYLGETSQELACAVEMALNEPKNSEKRQRRIEAVRSHTTQVLGEVLEGVLNFAEEASRVSVALP
jgi:hypothetical protein